MRRRPGSFVFSLLPIALLLLTAPPAPAQDPASPPHTAASETVAQEAISRLRSPYCPGLMLEVCPSAQAALLRDSIHDLAAQGRAADEIVEWMIARHGEEWRAVPERRGAGLWAWVIPPLALLLGGGWLAVRLRRMRRAEGAAEGLGSRELTADERERLDAAMREWERVGEAGE